MADPMSGITAQLSDAQKAAVRKLMEIIHKNENEKLLGSMEVSIDIDTRLLKAIVDQAVEKVEEQIEQLNENRQRTAKELALIIKPRIEMIGYLYQKRDYYQRLLDDPDYNRCVFNLNNTINYLIEDVRPYIQQLSGMTGMMPSSWNMGYDTPTLWSKLTQIRTPQGAVGALMAGGGKKKKTEEFYRKKELRERIQRDPDDRRARDEMLRIKGQRRMSFGF